MALERVNNAPLLSDFKLLSEHQEQTPGTFFGGKPVLYLHAPGSNIRVPREHYAAQPDIQWLSGADPSAATEDEVVIPNVDVWVTSQHMLFYSPATTFCLRIEYPTITVTAQDGKDVLLELNLSDADTADEDIEFLQLRITPTEVNRHAPANAEEQASAGAGTNGTTSHNDASTALFKAISDCQELNPDPPQPGDEDEDGGAAFDETAPGASGWITSENMADFMDENGNLRMPAGMTVVGGEEEEESAEAQAEATHEPLGEGAGRTRTAAEALEEEEEGKWQRTG